MSVYLIEEETLTNIADAIRENLPGGSFEFISGLVDNEHNLTRDIEVFYTEFVDCSGYSGLEDGNHDALNFVMVGLGYNEDLGMEVPILYDDWILESADPHYYCGTGTIDGIIYDKWIKGGDYFRWDSDSRCYKYTERIITGSGGGGSTEEMTPLEMPQKILEMETAPYILYGSYTIRKDAAEEGLLPKEEILWENDTFDIDDVTVFYHGGKLHLDPIWKIQIDSNFVKIQCEEIDLYYKDDSWCEVYDGQEEEAFELPGSGQIIFTQPQEVSYKFYRAFTRLTCEQGGNQMAELTMKQIMEGTLSVYGGYHPSNYGSYALPGYAFAGISTLRVADLSQCTLIGEGAFLECTSLSKVYNLHGVIGSQAFRKCSALTELNFQGGEVGYGAFGYCSNLKQADLRCSTIGDYAFVSCKNLSSVILRSITTLGSNAFLNCSALSYVKIYGQPPVGDATTFSQTHANLQVYAPSSVYSRCARMIPWLSFYTAGRLISY